eukprot:SM000003S11113  [mRNA]  locus=s3:1045150:1048393:+ [translate_table: standard]
MKIAVEGCAHGDLDNIYATLQHLEQVESIKVDLLVCCGDFQAVRNEHDLETMACPAKYRTMNTFWKYYSGEAVAPILTIFIGGNHEAQNHLWELFYGGWVAPNIYYLGAAGVVKSGGIRIGGLSGIYKPQDYHQGHHERPPYDYQSMRSSYHIRSFDVGKLKLLKEPIDIFVSHDWPNGIWEHGNVQELVRRKPFFKSDIDSGRLGSQPSSGLLHHLQPSYWFSAHLHVKFAAAVKHPSGQLTKFLALDKCLPNRNFLQASNLIVSVILHLSTLGKHQSWTTFSPISFVQERLVDRLITKPTVQVVDFSQAQGPLELHYDEEWLAVTKACHPFLPLSRARYQQPHVPDLASHRAWVQERIANVGSAIPRNFTRTAPAYRPQESLIISSDRVISANGHVRNPQMLDFLELLGLPYIFNGDSQSASQQSVLMIGTRALPAIVLVVIHAGSEGHMNPEEIELPEEDESAD